MGRRLPEPISDETAVEAATLLTLVSRLYDEGNDMIYLVRGKDSEKKAQAKELAKDFQTRVKAADKFATSKDYAALAEVYKPTAGNILFKAFTTLTLNTTSIDEKRARAPPGHPRRAVRSEHAMPGPHSARGGPLLLRCYYC
jgi:hypothetical protein